MSHPPPPPNRRVVASTLPARQNIVVPTRAHGRPSSFLHVHTAEHRRSYTCTRQTIVVPTRAHCTSLSVAWCSTETFRKMDSTCRRRVQHWQSNVLTMQYSACAPVLYPFHSVHAVEWHIRHRYAFPAWRPSRRSGPALCEPAFRGTV